MLTAKEFEEKVGRAPEQDDLDRVNCKEVGRVGHLHCGWCKECDKPRFICGHVYRSIQD